MAGLSEQTSTTALLTKVDRHTEHHEHQDIVQRIIHNAKYHFYRGAEKRKRSQTLFYKFVIGGASTEISQVIERMQQGGVSDRDVLNWLMGENDVGVPPAMALFPEPTKTIMDMVLRVLCLGALWVLLTPIIYLVHSCVTQVLNCKMAKDYFAISKFEHLEFPLAFAVFSGKKEMIIIFLDYGLSISAKDDRGYNVIHFLADLSRDKLENAKKSFDVLNKMAHDKLIDDKELHNMTSNRHIKYRQPSPIEFAVQFGSPEFATDLMNSTMINKLIDITKNELYLVDADGKMSKMEDDNNNRNKSIKKMYSLDGDNDEGGKKEKYGWHLLRMDVTAYSSSALRYAYNSYLLHLIIARPSTDQKEQSWWVVDNASMHKWISLKFKEWKWFIISNSIFEVGVTCLLILTMLQNGQGDMLLAPNQALLSQEHVHILLNRWYNRIAKDNFMRCIPQIIKPNNKYYQIPLPSSPELEAWCYEKVLFRNVSIELLKSRPDILESRDIKDYVQLAGIIRELGFNNFDAEHMSMLYSYSCVYGDPKNKMQPYFKKFGDFVEMDNCTLGAADSILPACEKVGLAFEKEYFKENETWDEKTKYEFVIATSLVTPIYKGRKLSRFKNPMRFEMNSKAVLALLIILSMYFFAYVIADIILRTATLMQQIKSNISLYSLFSVPLPGSYIKGQCNLFCSCGFIVLIVCLSEDVRQFFKEELDIVNNLKEDILKFDHNKVNNISTNIYLAFLTVTILVSRVILHLHSMKLIPWVGMFVITTFQMAADLLQFTLLYVFVLFTFSILFHLFSRDDNCPTYRDKNNFAVVTSMFSAFALTFGHVSISFDNIAVMLTYIIYAVTSIILLLNLIIAVMSSTAARVVEYPWSVQLYEENLLVEALGIEHWYFKYFMPRQLQMIVRKNAGFRVKENETKTKYNVSVDVFEEYKINKKDNEEDENEADESSTYV